MPISINAIGLLMYVWYVAYRWNMLGTQVGTLATENNVTSFTLNWWFAPINITTAYLSIPFLIITLFSPESIYLKHPNLLLTMFFFGIFLLSRNLWYTIEDVKDYIYMITHPGAYSVGQMRKQLFYIIIDLGMVVYSYAWLYKHKGLVE